MKTSSKVILENISINKDLRMNINLIDDSTLRELFNKVNHHIDEFNHEKLKSFIDVTKNNNDDESELSKIKQLQRRLQT